MDRNPAVESVLRRLIHQARDRENDQPPEHRGSRWLNAGWRRSRAVNRSAALPEGQFPWCSARITDDISLDFATGEKLEAARKTER
jgi:hypothetical protein